MMIIANISFFEWIIFFQVVFEMLPVSSSAQVRLVELFCVKKLFFTRSLNSLERDCVESSNFLSDIALIIFFRRRVIRLFSEDDESFLWNAEHVRAAVKLFLLAGLANAVTMIFYFLKKSLVLFFEVDNRFEMLITFPLAFGLLNSLFFKDRYFPTKKPNKVSIFIALALGLAQSVALFKGISRLGITFVIARWLNVSEKNALLFSYILHFQLSVAFMIKFFSTYSIMSILQLFSWTGILLIITGTLLSYPLLLLTYKLALQKRFYYFSMVYPLSLAVLLLICF